MKKIAFVLFMLFTMVQIVPSVMAFFSESTSVFIADEEKGNNDDKKVKKDFTVVVYQAFYPDSHLVKAVESAVKISSPPFLKKPTPPPNFC